MLLEINNRRTHVDWESKKERRWLDDVLSIDVPNAEYVPAFKNGLWDGKKRLLDGRTSTFPTGLLSFVLEQNQGRTKPFHVEVSDRRTYPYDPHLSLELSTTEWREYLEEQGFTPDKRKCQYQAQAVTRIMQKTLKGYPEIPWMRGVVQLPTGSGKTILGAGLLHALERPMNTLFLCNRLDLLVQSREALQKVLNQPIGMLGQGKRELYSITCATVQTLKPKHECQNCGHRFTRTKHVCPKCRSRNCVEAYVLDTLEDWLNHCKVLIIDECHKVGFNEYATVLDRVPAYTRIGLSATPFSRRDPGDVLLLGVTSDVVARLRPSRLTEKGLLARPVIELVACREPRLDFDPMDESTRSDDALRRKEALRRYRIAYKDCVVENEERHGIIVSLAKLCVDNGWPTLILVTQIRHGHVLRDILSTTVPKVEYLHGTAKIDERRLVTAKFIAGDVPVLIASTIFDEAVDIPNIKALILAGAGNSPIKTIQRVGRGMRKKGGDNVLHVYDFMDLTNKALRKQSMERVSTYEAQGYEVIDTIKEY